MPTLVGVNSTGTPRYQSFSYDRVDIKKIERAPLSKFSIGSPNSDSSVSRKSSAGSIDSKGYESVSLKYPLMPLHPEKDGTASTEKEPQPSTSKGLGAVPKVRKEENVNKEAADPVKKKRRKNISQMFDRFT